MLAIVIPYYNYKYFEHTLISLVNQKNKNFNVYIGNDASPDDPTLLIEKYSKELNIQYYQFNENLGANSLTKHWDRCISLSNKEDWIMLLADDDFLDSLVVENWYKYFDIFKNKSNVVRFASQIIYEDTETNTKVYNHPTWEKSTKSFFRKYKNISRSSLSEHVFKKSIYSKIGFYDFKLAWHSDDLAWIEFSGDMPIYTINDSVVYIRLSTSSISGREDNLELKKLASIQFYKILIKSSKKEFNKDKRFQLLRKYEDLLLLNEKMLFSDWMFLFYLYLLFFNIYNIKKFTKRFLKSYLQS